MARVGSDLRADRQYWPRVTYDLTVGPASSEIRPYQSNRSECLTLCESIASTTSSWRALKARYKGRSWVARRFAMRSRKFSNATGSPLTNAMFGIETPMGRTPLQDASLGVTSPRLKPLGYSVRPLRGHRQMSK